MRRALLILPIVLAACQPDDQFSQIGYFKDDGPNRVLMLYSADRASQSDVSAKAETLPHTAGQMTIAYLYAGPEPADVVTTAPDYFAAREAAYAPGTLPWDWRILIQPTGAVIISDCTKGLDPGGACLGQNE